jgi:hypothetical protein
MASISALNSLSVGSAPAQANPAAPANVGTEPAKYESQLSNWGFCASSKTSEGKAKIADKMESIEAQVKRAEVAKQSTSTQRMRAPARNAAHRPLRPDPFGAWLDAQV